MNAPSSDPTFAPADSSPPKKPRLSLVQRLVQLLAVVLTLSVTGGMVAYSAMWTFDAPRPQRLRSFEEDDATFPFLLGRVEANEHNLRTVQPDAMVLLMPATPPEEPVTLPDLATITAGQIPATMGLVQTDVDGTYTFNRANYEKFQPGEYLLLALSLSRNRAGVPASKDLEGLAKHIAEPAAVLQQRQYQLLRITLMGDGTQEQHVYFDEPAAVVGEEN